MAKSRRLSAAAVWLTRVGLMAGLAAGLAGCWLRTIIGNVVVEPDLGAQINDVVTAAFSGTTASFCSSASSPPDMTYNTCDYVVDGVPLSSTTTLIAEQGLFGVLLDPLILEVPSNVISATGSYDIGSGPQPLIINHADSFPVTPGQRITAETGTTFLFLDVPGSALSGLPSGDPTAGPVYSYTLSFHQTLPISQSVPAVQVKAMLAGTITVLWQTYYIPLLPCASTFAAIPAVTIPRAATPQNLETTVGDLIRNHSVAGCQFATYDFSTAAPPAGLAFLPLIQR